MEINIESLIKDNRVVALLHNECNTKHKPLKDDILAKREIRLNYLEGIAFDDIEVITPNIDSNVLFDKHRYNGYNLYSLFSRDKDGKLQKFKYTLAVLGKNTGEHKYIDTIPKPYKEMSNEDILAELGIEVEVPEPKASKVDKIINIK